MIIGIDIAGDALRAVKIKGSKTARLYDYLSMDVPAGTVQNGRLVESANFTDALWALRQELKIKSYDPVYLGLPDHVVRFNYVTVPKRSDYHEAIAEAQDIIVGRQSAFEDPVTALLAPAETADAIVLPYTFVLNKHVRAYLDSFTEAGYNVVSAEPQIISNLRFLSEVVVEDCMIIHVSGNTATISTFRPEFHQLLNHKVSFEEAFSDNKNHLVNQLINAARIQNDLFGTLETTRALPPQIKSIYLLGCGNASLVRDLGTGTGIKVTAPSSWYSQRIAGISEEEVSRLYYYITAMGLALKPYPAGKGEEKHVAINHKPTPFGRLSGAFLRPFQEVAEQVTDFIARVRGTV